MTCHVDSDMEWMNYSLTGVAPGPSRSQIGTAAPSARISENSASDSDEHQAAAPTKDEDRYDLQSSCICNRLVCSFVVLFVYLFYYV